MNFESAQGKEPRATLAVLGILFLLWMGGVYLTGPWAWGFNHLGYFPVGWAIGWAALGALLFAPPVQRRLSIWIRGSGSRFFFETWYGPIALLTVLGSAFVLLKEQSFFMGDGYLIGELVSLDNSFRGFDAMDYLLHSQAYQRWGGEEGPTPFDVYQLASILAGFLGTSMLLVLLRRLPWEGWRRVSALILFLFSGSIVLFYGYVESYSYLFAFLSAFYVAGILYLERRLPLWPAATLFGFALFFHLTAIFSLPALAYLAIRGHGASPIRRWFEFVVPVIVVFGLAVILHINAGFDGYWFEKEFMESENAKSLWVPIAGERGFFSVYHWKDLFNLALLTAPVSLAIILTRLGRLRARLSERPVQFLLVQVLSVLAVSLLLDRKLGGARDWDLLAAHSFGLALLACLLFGSRDAAPASNPKRSAPERVPGPEVSFAITTAVLLTLPWIVLLHWEERSIERFLDTAADYPSFARAYAYEEVGKYYRNAGDFERAQVLYEMCVDTHPGNSRFHILLGSIRMVNANYSEDPAGKTALMKAGEASYREALRISPDHPMALSNLSKNVLAQGRFEDAYELYSQLVKIEPGDPVAWEGLGLSAIQSKEFEVAADALQQCLQLAPRAQVRHPLGVALLTLDRFEESAEVFREAIRSGEAPSQVRYGLAAAIAEKGLREVRAGGTVDPAELAEAEKALHEVIQMKPTERSAKELYDRIQELRAGKTEF